MGAGDVGADAYGNTTRLSTSEQQYYINLALSKGASRADVDSFIQNNGVNDLGRIVSALGLSSGNVPIALSPGAGTGTGSYSAALVAGEPAPDQLHTLPYVATVPAPEQGAAAVLTSRATAADAQLFGTGAGGGSSAGPAGPAGLAGAAGAPGAATPFPIWALLAVGVVLGILLLRENG